MEVSLKQDISEDREQAKQTTSTELVKRNTEDQNGILVSAEQIHALVKTEPECVDQGGSNTQSSEQIQNVSVRAGADCVQHGNKSSQISAHVQNILGTEFSDLLSEGKPVSFVIVGEGEDAMEWIQQTSIVVDNQPLCMEAENQRVIVMKTEGVKHSHTESKCILGTQKRKQIDSADQPKQIKLSTDHVEQHNDVYGEQQGVSCDHVQSETGTKAVVNSESGKKLVVAGSFSRGCASLEECSEAKVTQGGRKEYSPVITIFASSSSSSSSTLSSAEVSTRGSSSKLELERHVPVHQHVTVSTDLLSVKATPATSIHHTVSSIGGNNELSPIKISSPGANVELVSNNDSADSSEKESNKEPIPLGKDTQVAFVKVNAGSGMVYRCTECDYASSNKHYYKQHVDLVHNTARPFKCPFCDYAGKRGHALREHLVVHSAQRPYSCPHCNATFRKKGHLTNHTKLHAATSSGSSSGTLVAVPLPQGLAAETSTVLPGNATQLIKIPLSGSAVPSTIAVKGLPTGTGNMATVATGPVLKRQVGSAPNLPKMGQFWCALCCKDMGIAASFQEHLKTVHSTDRLYGCESCDYVTAKKEAIMLHLSTHIAPAPAPPNTQLVPLPSGSGTTPSASTANAPTPLYGCTQCGFTTPLMATLVAHAASHTASEGTSKEKASSQASKGLQQHAQTSKVICTECGHVADNAELMRSHMWTHISSSETEPKDKGPSQESVQQKASGSSAAITSQITTTSKATAAGLNPLPENAAFKCTECSYVSRDASQFVKHMLVHKTQHNQAPKCQGQDRRLSDDGASVSSNPGNATPAARSGTSYRVKPVTTENTCQNTESSPFVHDAATGRFRCTLCGYTCEYQRTIKAHIWKHSGNRHVDYPIFQNGPLSMYEDPYPTSHPIPAGVRGLYNQSSTATSTIDVVVTVPSHPGRPCHESSSSTKPPPVSVHPVTQAASSSGAAPLSVKFITVSGSQVLHSSGPLPPGKLKLVPVQPAETEDVAVSTDTASKPLVVHAQCTESGQGGKTGGTVMLGKQDGPVAPAKNKPQGEDEQHSKSEFSRKLDEPAAVIKSLPEEKDRHQTSVKENDAPVAMKSLPQETNKQGMRSLNPTTDGDADTLSAGDSVTKTGLRSQSSALSGVDGDRSNNADSAMTESTHRQLSLGKSPAQKDSSGVSVPEASVSSAVCSPLGPQIASAKHTLPACAPSANTCQRSIAVAVQSSHNTTVPTVLEVQAQQHSGTRRNSAPASAVTDSTEDTGLLQGRGEQLSDSQTSSRSQYLVASPRNQTVDDFTSEAEVTDRGKGGRRRSSTECAQQHGMALRTQTRRQSITTTEPNVLVETVDTFGTHSALTGLRSQQNSPRVARSLASSPSPSDSHHIAVSPQPESSGGRREIKSTARVEKMEESSEDDEVSTDGESRAPQKMSPCDSMKEINASTTQSSQDSDSAITLLSLLKRGPNFNPACPPQPSHFNVTDADQEQGSADQSPDRSPTSSSETESVTKETSVDSLSKEMTSEMESGSSGKTGGGGGGICSTLLAVIEQLRERSRSESDPEDRSSQPPAKRRASRRRGQQESQDDDLELGDGENIERLDGGGGISYRCKLCHYTSSRVPLIRLHMRTHRQKDPFECSLCPMKAESSEMLQEHMIQHCKVRTYACKFCPQSFNHKSTLRAHMRAHNDTDPFLCDLCEFESSSPLEYRAHMQKHAGSSLLRCPHCPALLASRGDLHLHLAAVCPVASIGKGGHAEGERGFTGFRRESKKLMCSQCQFTTTDASRMEDHQASHAVVGVEMGIGVEGPLRCALCDFTAVSSRSLKSHMKRHANDQRYVQQPLEQYKCSLCGYVCHHLPSLKSHMWRHASDQNYSYHFTNDVINAAIDYDTNTDPPPVQQAPMKVVKMEPHEPELLDKVLSAEHKIIEGQMSRAGGSKPVCWVRFRCCQCGFETINKAKLNLHMRTHADIINRTLKVSPGSPQEGEAVAMATDIVESDGTNIKIVYGPV